jgi:hypothetical protein
MANTAVPDLRYPIGPFVLPESVTVSERKSAIDHLRETPAMLRDAVGGLRDDQLDTPHRPEGWTLRQIAHHLPDSHLNAYARVKLALTEDTPTIRPYDQERWAELADSKIPVEMSLLFMEGLHARWVALLESIADADWSREIRHPEIGILRVDQVLAWYDWHGRHHVAQITSARERNGW